jgi:hypothetical protein
LIEESNLRRFLRYGDIVRQLIFELYDETELGRRSHLKNRLDAGEPVGKLG